MLQQKHGKNTNFTLVPLLVDVPGSSATLPDDMASLGSWQDVMNINSVN